MPHNDLPSMQGLGRTIDLEADKSVRANKYTRGRPSTAQGSAEKDCLRKEPQHVSTDLMQACYVIERSSEQEERSLVGFKVGKMSPANFS